MPQDLDQPITPAHLRVNIAILTCAISAGIHGALVPDHFREGAGAGLGFVVATVLFAVLAVVLTRSASQLALVAMAAAFIGVIAGYAVAITTGVPVLHPDVEAIDGLALVTKAIEAAGLIMAASLVWQPSLAALGQPKGPFA
jgi:hypothetical protein